MFSHGSILTVLWRLSTEGLLASATCSPRTGPLLRLLGTHDETRSPARFPYSSWSIHLESCLLAVLGPGHFIQTGLPNFGSQGERAGFLVLSLLQVCGFLIQARVPREGMTIPFKSSDSGVGQIRVSVPAVSLTGWVTLASHFPLCP